MTSLAFTNPMFLWMLPAAALPILFHLFHHVRRRPRPFPSLIFLRRADPRLSMRRRIREWIALLLRCLLLLLALLALARPVWLGRGPGGPVTTVLVLDNSASMAAQGRRADRSCMDDAVDACAAILADLGPADRAGLVLLVDDPTAAIPAGLTTAHADLRAALGRVRVTHASGSPVRALERAFATLTAAGAARAEVHVFTDAQATEWDRRPAAPLRPPQGVAIAVHRLAPSRAPTANVSLVRLAPPPLRTVAGRTAFIEAELRNNGRAEAHPRVQSLTSDSESFTQVQPLPPGDTRKVRIPWKPPSPGLHWVRVWVEDEALPTDNEGYLALQAGAGEAAVLAGRREEFGTLPLLLSPSGSAALSGIAVSVVPPADLPAALARRPALAVCTWQTLAAGGAPAEALRRRVAAGGSLLLLAAPGAAAPPPRSPDWAGARPAAAQRSDAGRPMLVLNRSAALWDDLRDDDGNVQVANLRAFRYSPLILDTNAVPLLGLDDGSVVLAARPAGSGMVYAAGFALTPADTTLPLKPASLALFQGMALLDHAAEAPVPAIAGSRVPVPATAPGSLLDVGPMAGTALAWRGRPTDAPDLPWAGVYRVQCAGRERTVSVVAAADEGDPRTVGGDALPVLAPARHRISDDRDPASIARSVRRQRTGVALFLALHVLAIAAFMAETWVTNPARLAPAAGATAAAAEPAGGLWARLVGPRGRS